MIGGRVMELTQLTYFKTVAKLEHITKAANELNISQPALSRTIARFEESVGAPLFNREGNRIELNSLGRMFLQHTERALYEIEDGMKEISRFTDPKHQKITFATTESGFIAGPLRAYMMANPQTHILQYLQSIPQIEKSLENGDIDFAISFSPIKSPIIEWIPLISEEILAFVSTDHRLAKRKQISLQELKNERFIFNSTSFNIRETICEYCRNLGYEPDIFYEGFEIDLSDSLLEANLGVSFVPSTAYIFRFKEFPLENPLAKPLKILEPVGRRVMGISVRGSRLESPAARHLYSFLIDYFKTVDENFDVFSIGAWAAKKN